MLSDNKTLFASPTGAGTQESFTYTLGDSALSSFPIITGYGGYITTADNDTLELSDNFTVEMSGYIDTDNGTDKNLVYKQNAIGIFVSPTISGNVTAEIYGANITIEQTTPDTFYGISNDASWRQRVGQRLNGFPISTVNSASFYLMKTGLPTGTANIRLRKVSDDSVIGTLGTLDVATLTGSYVWYDFASPVNNPTNQDVRISFEWNNNISPDYVRFGYNTANVSIGLLTTYMTATWTDESDKDALFKINYSNYEEASASVSATGVSNGAHTIEVETDNNSVLLGIGIDLASDTDFPTTGNLALNLPLHHTDMQSANLTSKDTNQLVGTVTGATWESQGRHFDGVNDKISIPDNDALDFTGNFTMSIWFNADSFAGGWFETGQFWQGEGGGTDNKIFFCYDLSSTFTLFNFYKVGIGDFLMSSSLWTASPNTWYQIVVTRDTNEYTFYKDGIANGTANQTEIPPAPAADFEIGKGQSPADGFDGIIGEVQFYNKALSPSEIQQNYNATRWRYDGSVTGNSDTYFQYSALGSTSVPDNNNAWTFLQNNVMPYSDNITMSINGTQQLYYAPTAIISGTTLPDRAGTTQNGVITWGTNPSGITVGVGGLLPVTVPVGVPGTPESTFVPSVGIDVQTTGTEGTNLPLYELFKSLLTDYASLGGPNIPMANFWKLVAVIFGWSVGTAALLTTRNVVIGLVGYLIGFAVPAYSMSILDVWVPIVYGIGAVCLAALLWKWSSSSMG